MASGMISATSGEGAKCAEIHIELGRACHLRCKHCSSIHNSPIKGPDFTIEQWKAFLEHIDSNIKLSVFFTGGEPLLFLDLKRWILETSSISNVIDVGIFTSGSVLDNETGLVASIPEKFCNEIATSGLAVCYVSVYSFLCREHDSITRSIGSFDSTIATIKKLVKCGIKIRFHYVPIISNNLNISGLLDLAQANSVEEIRFLRLVSHGRATENWEEIGKGIKEQLLAANTMYELAQSTAQNVRVSVAGFPSTYDCRPIRSGGGCQAGISLLYIDIFGDIFGCACAKNNAHLKLSNVRDHAGVRQLFKNKNLLINSCIQDRKIEGYHPD